MVGMVGVMVRVMRGRVAESIGRWRGRSCRRSKGAAVDKVVRRREGVKIRRNSKIQYRTS
jgi:hypothetical protein